MACEERLCMDEKSICMMQEALEDVGKWIYYITDAAKQHNVPWNIITEGIKKAGAYIGYTEFSRTQDLKELLEELEKSDFFKAHEIHVIQSNASMFELELGYIPVIEAACNCPGDEACKEGFKEAYMAVFQGVFETYGLAVNVKESSTYGRKWKLNISRL